MRSVCLFCGPLLFCRSLPPTKFCSTPIVHSYFWACTANHFRSYLSRGRSAYASSLSDVVDYNLHNVVLLQNCTPGQLALAWVLAQGEDVIPIPGTKRVKYLEENIRALDVKLSDAEVRELSNIIPPDAVSPP